MRLHVSGGGTFAAGSTPTVTATPNIGYRFVNWTEGGTQVSTSAGYTLPPLAANHTLVANFNQGSRAVSDFDGDGMSDILWRHANGDVAIWLMNGGQVKVGLSVASVGPIGPSSSRVISTATT